MARLQNPHYRDRVNRVLDHIGGNLTGDLSLGRLADIGCFSTFHFHRIFQGVTGETLNQHVRRVRLERAALLLRASPQKRVTDAALETGFAGTSEFSRAFKSHFGHTASSWDRKSPLDVSKISTVPAFMKYLSEEELRSWKAEHKDVKVLERQFNAFRYVYNRTFEPRACSNHLVEKYHALIGWLKQRGTDVRDVVIIGMSQDDPAITPTQNYRYDLGVAFLQEPGSRKSKAAMPSRSECDAHGFSFRDFEPRPIVSIHCVGDLGHVANAWQFLYRIWLPDHPTVEPANLPAMEMFVRLPEEIGWETFDLQACIPLVS